MEEQWRSLPVDLDELAAQLGVGPDQEEGYLDLQTGEVLHHFMTDPFEVGDDAAVDVEEEPDRWHQIERQGSREGWQDMSDFTATVEDQHTRELLEVALMGKGAFRRFKDTAYRLELFRDWTAFGDAQARDRARAYLADLNIRVPDTDS